ncbi:MAG: hypothetical protein GX370_04690 [Clostridia bacterium]|jgi:hypothetical protein|nr:hypothetical protein [Clostridia bacterium]
MAKYEEIPTNHMVDYVDKKHKDKSIYDNSIYNYDYHTNTFTALNNSPMTTPFSNGERTFGYRP